jgi:hypothetical protein
MKPTFASSGVSRRLLCRALAVLATVVGPLYPNAALARRLPDGAARCWN